jgi:chromosome segregation ATPase
VTPGWLTIAQLLASAGGLGGLASLLAFRGQRRQVAADVERSGAEAARSLSESAVALLGPYRRQVSDLTRELAEARATVADLSGQLTLARGEVERLRAQVADLSRDLPRE